MTQAELVAVEAWFERYSAGFRGPDGTLPPMLALKLAHSQRVAENARVISAILDLDGDEQRLAEGAGLLHDVGRFPQFARFGSFQDAVTVDHGAEGRLVLETEGPASLLAAGDWERLLYAVNWHNRKHSDLPAGDSPQKTALLCLIRDADKLDVMEVVLTAVAADGFQDLPAMLPSIRLDRGVSPGIVEAVLATGSASMDAIATLADFLVLVASWFYDLNYEPTRQLADERDVLGRIRRELPETDELKRLFTDIEKTATLL